MIEYGCSPIDSAKMSKQYSGSSPCNAGRRLKKKRMQSSPQNAIMIDSDGNNKYCTLFLRLFVRLLIVKAKKGLQLIIRREG
mmetsp:Transcript_535/g.883  ORF Transcript_535/g.883 Transcript_535/m.883 type:complete len:82 (-) Transcript_535:74-319(-)